MPQAMFTLEKKNLTNIFRISLLSVFLFTANIPQTFSQQLPLCCTQQAGCNLTCQGGLEDFSTDNELRVALGYAIPLNPAMSSFRFSDQVNSPCLFTSPTTIPSCLQRCDSCSCANLIYLDGGNEPLLASQLHRPSLNLSPGGLNSCLKVNGRFIVDMENFSITSGEVIMCSCAEIVVQTNSSVQPQRHLRLTKLNIHGCETMWRGITVERFGRLTMNLVLNISDAQHAVTAFSSIPSLFQLPTTLSITRSNFSRNHIGLYLPLSGQNLMLATPLQFNTFQSAGPSNPLLPSCDQLEDYDPDFGYAGIVTLFNNLNVGAPGSAPYSNTFTTLRNGIIAENCILNVYKCQFENMFFLFSDPPSFDLSRGVGVAARGGTTNVFGSRFFRCDHGIFTSANLLSADDNLFPQVRVGIEGYNTLWATLRRNNPINFLTAGYGDFLCCFR